MLGVLFMAVDLSNPWLIGIATGLIVLLIGVLCRRWVAPLLLIPCRAIKAVVGVYAKVDEATKRIERLEAAACEYNKHLDHEAEKTPYQPTQDNLYAFRSMLWCMNKAFNIGPYCQSCIKSEKGFYELFYCPRTKFKLSGFRCPHCRLFIPFPEMEYDAAVRNMRELRETWGHLHPK